MRHKILIFFLIGFIWSCSKSTDPTPAVVETKLVTATQIGAISKTELTSNLSSQLGAQANIAALFIKSSVKAYKISYKTKGLDNEDLVASGVIFVPDDITSALALASYQHGTITSEKDAPSNLNLSSEAGIGAFLASTGYLLAMPDYLGYGDSKAYLHPYENRKGLAQANVDFLFAVKEFISNQKINWNKILNLAGYSEGGFATMSTLKLIQENYSSDFSVKAVSCGAGAYNKSQTILSFLKNKTSGESAFNRSYLWVMLTYDRIYKINRPLTDYFVEPYLSKIKENGINATIQGSFDDILTTNFKNGIINGTDTHCLSKH